MRWQLTFLSALVACGDGGNAEPNYCEIGQDAYHDALSELASKSPACSRDDECVRIDTDVDCNGFSASLCGTVVHRDAAPLWSPSLVCDPLDAYPPAKLQCGIIARCAGGTPVCEQGRCSERRKR